MNINEFEKALTILIVNELKLWHERFRKEKMRVLNLGCYPWHGYLELSFLTTDEDIESDEHQKYFTGDWRLYDFPTMDNDTWEEAQELKQWLNKFYEESDDEKVTELIFNTCAKALISKQVTKELLNYNLT